MNCETDFVARSEKFLKMSSVLAMSVIQNAKAVGMKVKIIKNRNTFKNIYFE